MKVLSALRAALLADSAVLAAAVGGVHILEVAENSQRPNIMLLPVSGSDGWSHQGADGLHQDLVRIYFRGANQADAINLAQDARSVLNGLITNAFYSVDIKLTQHVNTFGDYQDGAKIFRQIDDYRVHYRLD